MTKKWIEIGAMPGLDDEAEEKRLDLPFALLRYELLYLLQVFIINPDPTSCRIPTELFKPGRVQYY